MRLTLSTLDKLTRTLDSLKLDYIIKPATLQSAETYSLSLLTLVAVTKNDGIFKAVNQILS